MEKSNAEGWSAYAQAMKRRADAMREMFGMGPALDNPEAEKLQEPSQAPAKRVPVSGFVVLTEQASSNCVGSA